MKRTKNLGFKVSPHEERIIRSKARKCGMNLSAYARKVTLNKEIIVIDGLREFVAQLRPIGNNLNQLTLLAHQGKVPDLNLEPIKHDIREVLYLAARTMEKG